MTLELNPVGVRCNIACTYCYEHPMRDAGNFGADVYDLDAMKRGLAAEGGAFTLHGGEPLLMKLPDLEEIFRWGLERNGQNGVQTNGALITDEHVRLFKQYNVHVGFSMDGPDELNDSRWAGSVEKTRETTAKSQAALRHCLASEIRCSLIVTLYKGNATAERRPRLKAWLRDLSSQGLRWARLHALEIDHVLVQEHMALSMEETIDAFIDFDLFERELNGALRFDVFSDIRKLLTGKDSDVTCIWAACDPLTTEAVHGVDGAGELTNCGRTNKEGIGWRKADRAGFERYIALYHTPQEFNGCQGCRFFSMCKGQCPGTSVDGDWRNRSGQCELWKGLFGYVERQLLREGAAPLSLSDRREDVERLLVQAWSEGRRMTIAHALQVLDKSPVVSSCNNDHGDHWDDGTTEVHGDGHGDSPHGDAHGDHTDDAAEPEPVVVAPVLDHGDDHGDQAHGDSPHGDYTNPHHPYGDVAHGDGARVGVEQISARFEDKP